MSAAAARKIFRPGFTTKKRGWGLGLTLVKRIIEEYHDGRIWLERSHPGETVFMISLPVSGKKKG
jgi:signal transduction histidine kinase